MSDSAYTANVFVEDEEWDRDKLEADDIELTAEALEVLDLTRDRDDVPANLMSEKTSVQNEDAWNDLGLQELLDATQGNPAGGERSDQADVVAEQQSREE